MIQLAMRDGSLRDRYGSIRSLRQPLAMSHTSSRTGCSRAGMSAGSCCRSPSMLMTISPRAWSKPAARAPVWPWLRRSFTQTTRGSRRTRARMAPTEPSVLLSSTKISSYAAVIPAMTRVISS